MRQSIRVQHGTQNLATTHAAIGDAEVIALFASLKGERPTPELDKELSNQGRRICYPRCTAKGTLTFHFGGRESLSLGMFNLLEPEADAPMVANEAIEVAIVPGQAFTKEGKRLGRGGGFYDRTLPDLTNAKIIGYCWESQIVADIPTEAHDVAMDGVVTELHYYQQGKNG